jgi:hypothetical protein
MVPELVRAVRILVHCLPFPLELYGQISLYGLAGDGGPEALLKHSRRREGERQHLRRC